MFACLKEAIVTYMFMFASMYIYVYRNDPKFLDRQVLANSVDSDQTAPERSRLFAI